MGPNTHQLSIHDLFQLNKQEVHGRSDVDYSNKHKEQKNTATVTINSPPKCPAYIFRRNATFYYIPGTIYLVNIGTCMR